MKGLKNIRLKNYNYKTSGFYFVTIVCNFRQDLFLGKQAEVTKELEDLVTKATGVSLDYLVIMPNHVHVIFVLNNCKLHLGEVVRRFKAKVSHSFGQNVWQA